MSELLSNDQIAALVEAAREGKAEASLKRQRRVRRVREIDFTKPTKFTQEQQRRFERGVSDGVRLARVALFWLISHCAFCVTPVENPWLATLLLGDVADGRWSVGMRSGGSAASVCAA